MTGSTVSAEEREARAALSRLVEPGNARLSRTVAEHGAVVVLEEIRAESDVLGNRSDLADRLRTLDARADLERAAEQGIRFVVPGDAEWPTPVEGLDACGRIEGSGGAPLGLWARGPLRLDEVAAQGVAIVGSRSATTYGTTVAGDVSARVAHEGWTVVSGGAFGIDQAAHRGALAEGRTAVVLACGVDRPYPVAHQRLLEFVGEHGVIVSELPPGCTVTRGRFLTRNRVIAALSSGTVVIEAALRSGAINTASWTNELGRPLMAVPGPVTSAVSAGAHQLIRNRGAVLVTRGDEVLELLAPMGARTLDEPRGAETPRDWLDPVEKRVLDALPVRRAAGLASLATRAGLARDRVRRSLEVLAEAGFAEACEDGWRLGPLGRST